MLEKFLRQTEFSSMADFNENYKVNVPECFNFAYDVVDEWADTDPTKPALLWTDDSGFERQFTFADMKRESDRTASFSRLSA